MLDGDKTVDEQGTDQAAASDMLRKMCEQGFSGSVDDTALALGRSPAEINDHMSGTAEIDDDLVMKMRGIAQERGISIE
ncbi:MAG: hypothetical protein ABR530_08755 [Pyrinomonadaceae bacterium]